MNNTVEIKFTLTLDVAIVLEAALYRRGREDLRHAQATKDNLVRRRGSLLLSLGDIVKGQRRSQQKFDLEGG